MSTRRLLRLSTTARLASLSRVPLLGARELWSPSSVHPVIIAPVVYTGLMITLWTYKCLMMVVFQSRIIYMPGIPPGARREKISDYSKQCRGIQWEKGSLTTSDGCILATAASSSCRPDSSVTMGKGTRRELIIVYFQGNASSTPPRLPELSALLSELTAYTSRRITTFIPSYRGYWTSTGRPYQRGIELDLVAIFAHLSRQYPDGEIVVWGQSIGCGILMTGLAQWRQQKQDKAQDVSGLVPRVVGIILETPFVSVAEMLTAVYPQRWLPYRYLGRFLWNRWELLEAMTQISTTETGGWTKRSISLLVLEAGADEIVPTGQAARIASTARQRRGGAMGRVDHVTVDGALHNECVVKHKGRKAVVDYLIALAEESWKE